MARPWLRLAGRSVDAQLRSQAEPPRYYRFNVAGGEGVKLAADDRNAIAFLSNGWRLVYNVESRLDYGGRG